MGFMSRRVLPVCGNMCVCCPGLRSRSRQPVKRYKKLCAEIFPKTQDELPNERKIAKLSDYAARNPLRIPKIAVLLEQRGYKELKNDHFASVHVIMTAFSSLLVSCKEHMTLFAISLLSMIHVLLEQTLNDDMQILACQTLKDFIHSQTDGTYMHNLNGMIKKVCDLARENRDRGRSRQLRVASLQALSAMVWFMIQCSSISADFDEIVSVTLDNYEKDNGFDRGDLHHTWVEEVRRCEGRSTMGMVKDSLSNFDPESIKLRFKDPSKLTIEEMENPKVWAQQCIKNMVQLAKETSTVRCILEPIFQYFDAGKHWSGEHGLAGSVLCDMSYLMQSTGNSELLLAALVRHLDHKNIVNEPQIKTDIVKIASVLARQTRSKASVCEVSMINDLCRHLRKSIQAMMEVVGQQEVNLHLSLQNSVEECLSELVKTIQCPESIYSMMAMTLEKLPTAPIASRASIGAMLILSHIVASMLHQAYLQQGFPDTLFHQVLQAMMHRDAETRVAAHQIFCIILVPGVVSVSSDCQSYGTLAHHDSKRTLLKNPSVTSSGTIFSEKARKDKMSPQDKKVSCIVSGETKERSNSEERQDGCFKSSPRFTMMNFRNANLRDVCYQPVDIEMGATKLSVDQTFQMLSALWIEATFPDNLPVNLEAIAHTFNLSLLSSETKNQTIAVRVFQLALSLRALSLDFGGQLPLHRRKSLFTLSTAMLATAARIYNVPEVVDLSKRMLTSNMADSHLELSDDFWLVAKPHLATKSYGYDEHAGLSSPSSDWLAVKKLHETLIESISQTLCATYNEDVGDVAHQLSDPFSPVDGFSFGPQFQLESGSSLKMAFSKQSLSFDEVLPPSLSIDEDLISETSGADFPRALPHVSVPATPVPIISVGQLLESALEAAGQVASATISTSPISFSAMAEQCEAFGSSTRKKLSVWLNQETNSEAYWTLPRKDESRSSVSQNITNDKGKEDEQQQRFHQRYQEELPQEPWQAMRLPAASPFDNFLKAAGC